MKLRWRDDNDPRFPEDPRSRAFIAEGWLRAEIYHTTDEDEQEVPWNARIIGANKNHSLIGYETVAEAKRAVEAALPDIIEEIRRTLDGS